MLKNLRYIIILISIISLITGCDSAQKAYEAADTEYQKAQDPVRIRHVQEIAEIMLEYAKRTGKAPLQELSENENSPFMVVIGRSISEEDRFSELEVLNKGALYLNSKNLENILSKELERKIVLPRDPQKVPTFAPNVYVYLYSSGQMCIAAHLYNPSDISVPYTWENGEFHSHAKCFRSKT